MKRLIVFQQPGSAVRFVCIFVSYLLLASLAACSLAPVQQENGVFAEQRVKSPLFESAAECLEWMRGQETSQSDMESLGPRLVVASWNAQKTTGQRWEDEVHELIERSDILLLQEAAIVSAQQEVLPHPYVAVAEAFYSWRGPTGLLSASHVEPQASCTFLEREPVLRSRKASNLMLFPLQDRLEKLLVINIHSVNFSFGLRTYTRQMEQLEQVMASHAGPIIFGGDLNTWNQRRIDLVDELARRLQLQEVDFSYDNRARFMGRPLDRIYYRGLQLLEARTIASASSDHDPLIAVMELD